MSALKPSYNNIKKFLAKGSLVIYTIIGAVLGLALGFILNDVALGAHHLVIYWLTLPGTLFLRSLTLLVLPLVFVSVVLGVVSIVEVGSSVKKVALLTICFYLVTTVLSALQGLAAGYVVRALYRKKNEIESPLSIMPNSVQWDAGTAMTISNKDYTAEGGYFTTDTAAKINITLSDNTTVNTVTAIARHHRQKLHFNWPITNITGPVTNIEVLTSAATGNVLFSLKDVDMVTINPDPQPPNEISDSFANLVLSFFPRNLVGTTLGCPASGCSPQMVSLISFAVFFAFFAARRSMLAAAARANPKLAGQNRAHGGSGLDFTTDVLVPLLRQLNAILVDCIGFVMLFTPLAVLCLIAEAIGSTPINEMKDIFVSLGYMFLGCLVMYAFHVFILLPGSLFLITRRNPYRHLLGMRLPASLAFASSSSASTLPVTIRACIEHGYPPAISNFVLSLGASINMDGVGILLPNVILWLTSRLDIKVTFARSIVLILVSTLSSMGASPTPGLAPMVILVWGTLYPDLDVPSQLSFFIALDWLLDRFNTTVNVLGDTYGVLFVSSFFRDIDLGTDNQEAWKVGDVESQDTYRSSGDSAEKV